MSEWHWKQDSFWRARIWEECWVWKRGSLQPRVWFKLNLFLESRIAPGHIEGESYSRVSWLWFFFHSLSGPLSLVLTQKKRLWTPSDQPHSLSADHKKEAWCRSHRINTHCLLTQSSVKLCKRFLWADWHCGWTLNILNQAQLCTAPQHSAL